MANKRNIEAYEAAKNRLLEAGIELMRSKSFAAVGISEILDATGIPKGSFYHYFKSKEDFGLQVSEYYHSRQMARAREILRDESVEPVRRLQRWFGETRASLRNCNYTNGCLLCNFSTELGDTHPGFREMLERHWEEFAQELAECIALIGTAALGLDHLSNKEAGDWMMNAWSGALTRMKAQQNDHALSLFEKALGLDRQAESGVS